MVNLLICATHATALCLKQNLNDYAYIFISTGLEMSNRNVNLNS